MTPNQVLSPSQRWGALATFAAMLVLLGFFALHQWTNSGFFTPRFGPLEMLALYGPILVAFAAPLVRVASGQHNPARPFEAATNLSLALGSLWLAIVFPLDFTHLGDVLPGAVRFVVSWIGNDLGRLVLVLQVIIGVVTAPLLMLTFFSVRRHSSGS